MWQLAMRTNFHAPTCWGLAALLLASCASCSREPAGTAAVSSANVDSEPSPIKGGFLRLAERIEAGDNLLFGSVSLANVRKELARTDLAITEQIKLRIHEVHHLLRLGKSSEARQRALELRELVKQARIPEVPEVDRVSGLVNLRLAEQQNCIDGHCEQSCILPIERGGVHRRREPALRAAADFERYLATNPPDAIGHAWLLNILHMTLATYPDGVPEKYRIDPARFRSSYDIGRFVDVAPQSGLKYVDLAGGVIVEDFDHDGFLDVFTTTMALRGQAHLYHNQGNGHFKDVSEPAGVADQLGGLHCTAADYDNDGDTDIFIPRGGWILGRDGCMRKSLLRNNGDLTFTDVTREAGLAVPSYPTQIGVWGDFDNDGDLDLYVASESPLLVALGTDTFPSQLFRNNGNGTFTDIAAQAGVLNNRFAKGAAAGDYDNDGDLDIYVSNHTGGVMGSTGHVGRNVANCLYRNNGDGTFTDVAAEMGVIDPADSFATWFFDYDNDGWLDLFVAGYGATLNDIAAEYFGQPHHGERPRIFHNEQGQGFTDRTVELGLDHAWLPMGSSFGDLDNDGYLDIFLGTGGPTYEILDPSVVLRNDAGRGFQDVTFSSGMGHLQKGHGVSFADVDNDGDQDIFEEMGGAFPGDIFGNVLFANPGHGNRFLKVELVGTESNRAGVGARIVVEFDTPEGARAVHRAVGSQPSFGNLPSRQEIGLGKATRISRLEVSWPTSGQRQVFEDVPLDASIRITEGQPKFEQLKLRAFTFPPSTAPAL
jgi:FG-GAP-like repeat/ASPIC and UnbV